MPSKVQKHGEKTRKRVNGQAKFLNDINNYNFANYNQGENFSAQRQRKQKKKKSLGKTIAKVAFGGLGAMSLLSGGAGSAKAAIILSSLF